DPGFYTVDVSFLVNQDRWESLTEEQRAFLTETAIWAELLNAENEALNAEDRKQQAEAGIETIELTGEAAETWLKTAYEAGWEEAIAIDPENGPRLRELIAR
ncbi:MAG TPA: ABC transporter substrate-binding protein, partial [Alphaproteobacteria bacterium]|nr:ABC transporter substrate-binding protein [Alphaproteobacteria bacterium]